MLALLGGCIGMRTPLDDAAVTDGSRCNVTTTVHATLSVADVLIVLDRSESMHWSLAADSSCRNGDTGCSTRLAAIVPALGAVVSGNRRIRWGLEAFPAPGAPRCEVAGEPQVPIRDNNADAIKAWLLSFTTSLSTPTSAALQAATTYLNGLKDGNAKAILLATDGLPTCANSWADDDLPGAVASATDARRLGLPVYVIGIGPNLSNLNQLAVAGGTGSYYPVTSVAELDAALGSVARVVSSCTFKADAVPPSKDVVFVYADQKLVGQDPDNGWTFDASDATHSTITLTGTYCQDLLAGLTSQVQIVFYDCPGTPPPAILP
jgi:hypothetical protein